MGRAGTRIGKVMDVLANLGFVMRDTRREKVSAVKRIYGPETDGFRLSTHPVVPAPTLSVATKNVEAAELRSMLPGWLFYYAVTLVGPDGSPARLSAIRRELLDGERKPQESEIVFPAGELVVTEIPLGTP